MDSSDIKPAFTFNAFANTSQQREFLKAFEGFKAEWESRGYEALSANQANHRLSGRPAYPKAWKTEGPIDFVFGPPHFMQFIAFLKEPAITAAIEVILAGILHAALKRFGRVFGDHQDGKKPDKPRPDEQKSDGA